MRFKRAGIITWIIIAALFIYGVATMVVLRSKIDEAQSIRDSLANEVANMTAKNDEMRYALEHSDDDAVLEDIARGDGYVYNEEEIYKTE